MEIFPLFEKLVHCNRRAKKIVVSDSFLSSSDDDWKISIKTQFGNTFRDYLGIFEKKFTAFELVENI